MIDEEKEEGDALLYIKAKSSVGRSTQHEPLRAGLDSKNADTMGDEFWSATQELLQGAEPLVRKPKVRESERPTTGLSARRQGRATVSVRALTFGFF